MTRTRAPDPRPARTRTAIYAAVESLSTADAGEITVASITREAGISRPAFYSQFSGIDALAVAILTETFSEIAAGDLARRTADTADKRGAALCAARQLMFHIDRHWSFYLATLRWKTGTLVQEAVMNAYGKHVTVSLDLSCGADGDKHRHQDLVRYISGGTLALLTAWLLEDHPASPADMAERLLTVMPPQLVGEKT